MQHLGLRLVHLLVQEAISSPGPILQFLDLLGLYLLKRRFRNLEEEVQDLYHYPVSRHSNSLLEVIPFQ